MPWEGAYKACAVFHEINSVLYDQSLILSVPIDETISLMMLKVQMVQYEVQLKNGLSLLVSSIIFSVGLFDLPVERAVLDVEYKRM